MDPLSLEQLTRLAVVLFRARQLATEAPLSRFTSRHGRASSPALPVLLVRSLPQHADLCANQAGYGSDWIVWC